MGKSSPKILILSAYDVGGASIAAIRMHLGFLKIGLDSRFLTLHASSDAIPNHFQYSPPSDIQSRIKLKWAKRQEHKAKTNLKLPPGTNLSGEFSMPLAPFDVTTSEHWNWADVVILHWVNEWIQLETLVEKAGKKPLIWVMHDMHAFTGGCHYSQGCEKMVRSCEICPFLTGSSEPNLAHQFWKSKSAALSKFKPNLTITAPSAWMTGWSQRSSLFGQFAHYHIFNCLDTAIFSPRNKDQCREVIGIPADKTVLLCVIQSLDDRRKGFQLLIDALAKLENKTNVLLCTVGKSKNLSNQLPVSNLHLGSLVDERLMALVYNCADVFVHPAIEDNLPNVVVESLACGIPCAGFSIGGMVEMISNGQNGFLSSEITLDGLATVIEKSITTDWSKKTIAAEAKAIFDLEVQAKAFKNLIEKVIKN